MQSRNSYTYRSWETINGPVVNQDTTFIIMNEYYEPIYSAYVPAGKRLEGLDTIFAKHIKPADPFLATDFSQPGIMYEDFDWNCKGEFYVQDQNLQVEDTYVVYYDWTYQDTDFSVISNSPVPLLDYRMMFCFSVLPKNGMDEITWTWDDGTPFYYKDFIGPEQELGLIYTAFVPFTRNDFTDDPGAFTMDYSANAFDVVKATQGIPNKEHYITNGTERITVDNTCNTHCLYYRNELGAWNWLLVTGSSTMKENYTTQNYVKNANFARHQLYGLSKQDINYVKNIATSWDLKTGFMTESQAAKMVSLFRSNLIYLQDLTTKQVVPVNITTSDYQEKTYRNSGNQFAQYTFTVKLAYDKKMM